LLIAYSEFWNKKSADEAVAKLDNKYLIPNDFDIFDL